MNPAEKETITFVLVVAAAFLGWLTFWNNLKVRRAEWLSRLHESFYLRPELKPIRAALDYEGEANRELFRCIESEPENAKTLEPLVDYLNFFEFIAVLGEMDQLSDREIKLMFGYYLTGIGESRTLVRFCEKGGFKNLLRLLKRMGHVPSDV
jgi:hypothetical protein